MSFQSVQVAPDGDFVLDYDEQTPDGAWEKVCFQGSKWIFYPYPLIVKKSSDVLRERIVLATEEYEHMVGNTLGEVIERIKGK